MIILPTAKREPIVVNPRNLVLFGNVKIGKSTLVADLPECLILDFENGTESMYAMSINITSVDHLLEVGNAILEHNKLSPTPIYKYIAIDTITSMQQMCIDYAEILYSRSPTGTGWFSDAKTKYGTILGLPMGAGYYWLKLAFDKVFSFIKMLAPTVIQIGHLKTSMYNKLGAEFESSELDLIGALKRTVSANSDAIGYLYRKKDGNYLSFKTTETVICGARPLHLKNKEFKISWNDPSTNKIITFWDQIFI